MNQLIIITTTIGHHVVGADFYSICKDAPTIFTYTYRHNLIGRWSMGVGMACSVQNEGDTSGS